MLTLSKTDMKADVEKYVNKAMTLIHSPQTTKQIQASLAGPDPVQQVAHVTVMIMQRIDAAARQSGVETKDAAKVIAAQAIVNLLVELGEAAKKFTMDPEYKLLTLTVALQDYFKGEIDAGRIDPNKLKQTVGQELQKMDGKMAKEAKGVSDSLPQIAAKYNQSKGGNKPQPQQGV